MKTIIVLALTLLATNSSVASGFHTRRLQLMAKTLGLMPSAIPDSMQAYGKTIRVRTNAFGDISHIGYKLFTDEAVQMGGNTPVFNFIERYLLELDMKTDGQQPLERMDIDHVTLGEGSLQLLHRIDSLTPFAIDEVKRRMYRIKWTVKGQTVSLTFPADCQLLTGANAVELEEIMLRDLQRTHPIANDELIPEWDNAKGTHSKNMTVIDNGKFLSDMIRGDIYLTVVNGKRQLYCSRKNMPVSISNIMLTGQARDKIPLHLKLDKYGYKQDETDISLQQFVDYCKSEGCKLYFGIKTANSSHITGTLFAYNEKMAYCHVLSVDVPTGIISGEKVGITGTAYAYIPLQNVTEKFFTQSIHQQ